MGLFNYKEMKIKFEKQKEEYDALIRETAKLQKQKASLEGSIAELESLENDLNIKIFNRQNFFIETELKSIDVQTGLEFEKYIGNLFSKLGYTSVVTKASQDSGGDVLAQKDGKIFIIQCKNYSSSVGNKAVQEVYAAKGIYKADVAIVITNNYYTEQAHREANALNVELWDRNKLTELIRLSYDFNIQNLDFIPTQTPSTYNDYDSDEYEEYDELDDLLIDAIELAVNLGQISASIIQRKFNIGYARAGRLVDQMEERGFVSESLGLKPRKVLISKEEFEYKNEEGTLLL